MPGRNYRECTAPECRADIVFVEMEPTKNRAEPHAHPVNPASIGTIKPEDAKIALRVDPATASLPADMRLYTARYLRKADPPLDPATEIPAVSHYATCKKADRYRKPSKS